MMHIGGTEEKTVIYQKHQGSSAQKRDKSYSAQYVMAAQPSLKGLV